MNILDGIKNFLNLINDNWTSIIVIIGLCVVIKNKASDYFKKSDDEKIAIAKDQLKNIILQKITEAEKDYAEWSKAGSIKRSQVIEEIYKEYPVLQKVVNQEELVKYIDELIDSVMVKFHKRYPQQEVYLDLPEDIIIIPMDAILIEQVIFNLLENAVLHAEGMTKLALKVFVLGKQVVFEVSDNGCGIEKERLNGIFNGSYHLFEGRTPSSDSKKHNSGIGLSVCQTIVKAHDGAITAENNPVGGAVFRFSLNIEEMKESE